MSIKQVEFNYQLKPGIYFVFINHSYLKRVVVE